MRNKEEFEEYVRGLTEKKLEKRQERRKRIRRISLGLGSCAAVGICAALLVYMNSIMGVFGIKDEATAMNSGFSNESGAWDGENLAAAESVNETSTLPPQDKEYQVKGPSGAAVPEDSTESKTESGCDNLLPDYVNIVYRDGEEVMKLQKPENISRLVYALGSFDFAEGTDMVYNAEYIVLELVYSDKTVRYKFTDGIAEGAACEDSDISSEEVSELADLLERLIQSEQ